MSDSHISRRSAFRAMLALPAVPTATAQIIITPGSTTFGPPKDPIRYTYVAEIPWTGDKFESDYEDLCLDYAAFAIANLFIEPYAPEIREHARRLAPHYVRKITL